MPHPRACDAVRAACESAGTPEGPERERLADDIAALAQIFARASGEPMMRIRLDVVRTGTCRKFHVDNIRLRLLCTDRGAGTEHGVAPRGQTPDRIERIPRGAAALFRGRRWPGAPRLGSAQVPATPLQSRRIRKTAPFAVSGRVQPLKAFRPRALCASP